ncbi:MAG: dTDP-4-dehydrorhamnose reductase [Gammaproteobacteria bacterium]|nr:dTDP-4-dehydrorhamnose reductase [Gammaproteobacteria bacterium]
MKVLVFGKSGQVGSCLVELMEDQSQLDLIEFNRNDLDLMDIGRINSFITKHNPDWVINAAAYTAVDKAESDSDRCFRLNAEAPEYIATTCAEINANFIHYSTDYVFDGMGNHPYVEEAKPNPQSVYGKSKLAGELAILARLSNAIILRTAWVYAKKGNNFVNTMLRLAEEKPSINVVNDQFGSPTSAKDLAEVTVSILLDIANHRVVHQGGVFHATGQGETTWYEFCKQIMKETFNDETIINAISSTEYPTPAPRPTYSVLSNQKLKDVYGQELPHWQTALSYCLQSG